MAVDRKPEPPRTAAAWIGWEVQARRLGKWEEWAQVPAFQFDGQASQIEWIPGAEDHPFKGQSWCWRCVAEAQGLSASAGQHAVFEGTICWGGHEATPHAEDAEPDTREAGARVTVDEQGIHAAEAWITKLDPEGQPIPGSRERLFPPAEDVRQAVDTGTIFYTPPSRHPWRPFGEVRINGTATGRIDSPEPPEADQPERPALPDQEPVQADHRDTWPPSWTDDEAGSPTGNARPGQDPESQPEPVGPPSEGLPPGGRPQADAARGWPAHAERIELEASDPGSAP